MKHSFFYLIWFYFLTPHQQENVNNLFEDSYTDLQSEEKILEFLYLTSILSFTNLNHRRNKIFSFNPTSKNDMLFIFYYENKNRIEQLNMAQRIFLDRIVFRSIAKNKDYIPGNVPLESIQNPIIVEIKNV